MHPPFHPLPLIILITCILFPQRVHSNCYDPSPAFPPPPSEAIDPDSPALQSAFSTINASIQALIASPAYDADSFSIEVTSASKTIWSLYHTARDHDPQRPGAPNVQDDSVYRIASITKVFTVLGILQLEAEGKVGLEDPVVKYVEELKREETEREKGGRIRWDEITVRSLASQLSGIPREFAQGDLIILPNPTDYGLPPVSHEGLIDCDTAGGHQRACLRKDMLDNLVTRDPVFAPNQKSTYSNVAFNLLGLVIENATGTDYTSYVEQSILEPLGMKQTSMVKPDDSVAVLPQPVNYWDIDEGVERPTGSLYSSSHDLSIFLRHLLTHHTAPHASHHPSSNWFQPSSFSTTATSYIGMPWEILRSSSPLLRPSSSSSSRRPITFATKSGGLPGYYSFIIVVPEYEVGVTILVGGERALANRLRSLVTVPLVRGLEQMAQERLAARYTGTFVAAGLNSSLTIAHDRTHGALVVTRFVSNGTDMMHTVVGGGGVVVDDSVVVGRARLLHHRARTQTPLADSPDPHFSSSSSVFDSPATYRAQLVPTLLHKPPPSSSSSSASAGELWRILNVPERRTPVQEEEGVWDDFCITDEDPVYYAGVPLLEAVFWEDGAGKTIDRVELSGFRVELRRVRVEEEGRGEFGSDG